MCLGAEYYVDATNGNDRNTGRSEATAWKTIAKVNTYTGFVPGDRILLKRGRIWREQLIVSVSGTADKPITFGAYGSGSRPMLKGSTLMANWTKTGRPNGWRAPLAVAPGQVFFNGLRGVRKSGSDALGRRLEWAWSDGVLYVYADGNPSDVYEWPGVEASIRPPTRMDGLLHIKDREYVTVEDIDVAQSRSFGLYIKPWARYITVRGCDVGHSLDGGLVVPSAGGGGGASQITVEDCLIHHNNGGFKEGDPGVATYHEGLTMENVDGFTIRRTRVYDNYMEGVNFKRGARNGLIEYCDLYSNDLINLYLEGATNILIRYNRIYDCTYNAGIEFGIETNIYSNDTIHIHNNLFWGNSGAISFWAGPFAAQTRNIAIDNNTFYSNEFGVRWKNSVTGNYGGVNYIRNNLFWPYRPGWTAISDQTTGRQALARTAVDHNVFQKGALTDTMGYVVVTTADPYLVSPARHNFRLRAGSTCIDEGMNVGLTRDYDGHVIPQGQAPDVGAYEYVFPGDGIDAVDPSLAGAEYGSELSVHAADEAAWPAGLAGDETAVVDDGRASTWSLWPAGGGRERQIYASRVSSDPTVASYVKPLTHGRGDRRHPALARDGAGILYAVWQENVRGVWDVCFSVSIDGGNWLEPRSVAETGGNQTNPAVAADRQPGGDAAIVWQDDGAGNQDIRVLSSHDQFATGTLASVTTDWADQTDPAVAIDSEGTVVTLWTDMRNGSADIYGAASNRGPWTNMPVVDGAGNQFQPALAAGSRGRILHVVWTDDRNGDLDIFYAALNGLPNKPVTGRSIIEDTSHADQYSPIIAVSAGPDHADRVIAGWEDGRHGTADLCFADLSPGSMRTNIFVHEEVSGEE